jgi:urease accessory protein
MILMVWARVIYNSSKERSPAMKKNLFLLMLTSSFPTSFALAHTQNTLHSHPENFLIATLLILCLAVTLFALRKNLSKISLAFAATILLLAPSAAFAHHVMDFGLPHNFSTGFFAGIAHPLIALDHFAFLSLVAFIAAISRSFVSFPLLFLSSSLIGTLLPLAGISIPFAETFIIASLFVASILIIIKYKTILPSIAIIFGIFHGFAFSEGIIGAQTVPFVAYIFGLALCQIIIVSGGALIINTCAQSSRFSVSNTSTVAAAAVLGIAITFVHEPIINSIISVIV